MTLCAWIEKTGPKTVAELVGVDPSTVSKWKTGESTPRAEHILKIHQLTKGKIDFSALLTNKRGDHVQK